ncbi:unnamed protein product [Ilex paraguariensis]|uniref:Thiaminase-2/PQQC domain-containing protein n=1 Tax=Ilex paraguariensis TaxID=185542 RepID=A0ABC8RZG1_9AQUA
MVKEEREMGRLAVEDEGGVARRLWVKFNNESVFALYSPFVICLASGSLDSDSFLSCISQDVYFLKAFTQAYELAEEYADDDEDKAAIRKLRKRVLKRLETHDTLVRELGFELPKESTSDSATDKYTDFLLATASGKVEGEKFSGKIATPFEKTKLAAYTLGAIAPCMRLFGFINKEIQALVDPTESNHIYKKWIDNLSGSQKYQAAISRIEELVDKLSISLTGEELEVVEKLYHQAMKLEVKFISDRPVALRTIVPFSRAYDPAEHTLTIFSDFDMTCTVIDSSALLAEIAIRTAQKADLNECGTPPAWMSSTDLRTTWCDLSSQYVKEYEQCIESIMPIEAGEEFNYIGLCKALEQLSDFEKRVNLRVIQSGVLKGLNIEDIKWAGEHLSLQDGCRKFFQEIVKQENIRTDLHVLSYCWCGDLIRSAFLSGDQDLLNVHSNELVHEGSITTGEIIKKVESPMEKLEAFNDILKTCSYGGKHLTVYVGGSVGDLLCLLKADVGIVIGLSDSLRRLGAQFGIDFIPLFSGLVRKQLEFDKTDVSNWNGMSGILYTVSSWAEIHAFILGL